MTLACRNVAWILVLVVGWVVLLYVWMILVRNFPLGVDLLASSLLGCCVLHKLTVDVRMSIFGLLSFIVLFDDDFDDYFVVSFVSVFVSAVAMPSCECSILVPRPVANCLLTERLVRPMMVLVLVTVVVLSCWDVGP